VPRPINFPRGPKMHAQKEAKISPAAIAERKLSAWPPFLRAYATLTARIEERFRAQGLPGLDWYDVLWALEQAPAGRLRMNELADTMVITRSNLTRLIDRLESAGVVARDRDCADRRGAYAVLTPAGRRMRRQIWPIYAAAIHELFERHLNASEAMILRKALLRMIKSARAEQAGALLKSETNS
jgi:DNA-binding MarR family transcriptional regulator